MLEKLSGGRKIAIRYLINTHYHYDHTNGNEVVARTGAAVLAHPRLRERLRDGGLAGNGGSYRVDVAPAARAAVPTLVYESEAVIHLNGEEIRAAHLSEGHTDGDSIVFFKKANVVHLGDVFPRYGYPFIDVYGGGSIDGMIAACEAVLRAVPADARVIPGHGDVATVDDLKQYLEMLKQARAVVFDAIKAGRSLEQMRHDRLLSRWSARYASDIVPEDRFLEMLYFSLPSAKR